MKKACVLINCDLGKEIDILDIMRSIESVKEAHGTFGACDIVVEVATENPEHLREDITWKIRRLPAIKSTSTLMGLDN